MSLSLADLGIKPEFLPESASTTPGTSAVVETTPDNGVTTEAGTGQQTLLAVSAPIIGSTLARALYEVWRGTAAIVVDAPPGAGKTQLLVELLARLMDSGLGLNIVVAGPTKRGLADLVERQAEILHPRHGLAWEVYGYDVPSALEDYNNRQSAWLAEGPQGGPADAATGSITIRTVASCAKTPPQCDVLIIDEAYQCKAGEALMAANEAAQVLLVGDPGQIGPVVTTDTRFFEHTSYKPHGRAPEWFATLPDAVVLRLSSTYRLGQQTVEAIAPLYGFEFDSKRPARWLRSPESETPAGAVGEIEVQRLERDAAGPIDQAVIRAVADRAAWLVAHDLIDGATGNEDPLSQEDVCVVIPRNVQASAVSAALRNRGMYRITVGTADNLQGGQWHAVVALDPLVGVSEPNDFYLSTGRLCVMTSRHRTHLTWITDSTPERLLAGLAEESGDAARGLAVRRAMASISSQVPGGAQ